MIGIANYAVELRLNGQLIGNIRDIAENLVWSRKRTRIGVDSVSFTLNDHLFQKWCEMRGVTLQEMLAPLALDCRVLRDGVPLVGGYLATMPAYQANGTSASLSLSFDGYLNYVAKVFLNPSSSFSGPMGSLVQQWLTTADARAAAAGKAFGFRAGQIAVLPSVQESFDSYKAIRDAITDRCDNVTGAGPFEVYFHPDRTYDVIKESDFGEEITNYIVQYPNQINGVGALEISAPEINSFATSVIGVGSEDSGAISQQTNSEAVTKYGYAEEVFQQSSVSISETLQRNTATELQNVSSLEWQPEIKLSGRVVAPVPTGSKKIWLGDTIHIQNNEDLTGMASGSFRVNSLEVAVDANGAEEITPTLSRSEAINTSSFVQDFVRLRNNLLAVSSGRAARNMVQ